MRPSAICLLLGGGELALGGEGLLIASVSPLVPVPNDSSHLVSSNFPHHLQLRYLHTHLADEETESQRFRLLLPCTLSSSARFSLGQPLPGSYLALSAGADMVSLASLSLMICLPPALTYLDRCNNLQELLHVRPCTKGVVHVISFKS